MTLRVTVIGAGIVGVACAAYLQRDGHAVTLLDRDEPGSGASFGNAGALSPGSCVPLSLPGLWRKVPAWLGDADGPLTVRPSHLPRALPWLIRFLLAGRPQRIAPLADALRALHAQVFEDYAPLVRAAGAEALIRRTGLLMVYRSAAALAAAEPELALRRERGVGVDILGAPELRQLAPAVSPRYTHGVFLPEHGFTADPHRLVLALARRFAADGGRILRGAARHLPPGAVDIEGGPPLPADRVVVAAGAWSGELISRLGLKVPLESQRGYHMTLPGARDLLRVPVAAGDEKVFVTPMEGGLRVAGTVEFAGLAAPPDWRRAERLLGIAGRLLPGVATEGATRWMGHRPCLPDSLPAIGKLPRAPWALAAFGHGHTGMTGAPATGRLIADLIAGRPPTLDPSPYRPDRFVRRGAT